MRVDRADGFVGRNWLTRGGLEFGFYVEEADGVLLDRTKFFWNADYGHLSFTTDHNQIQNCDGMGAGDAAIYPGAAPETGAQATDFYPDAPRFNTTVTKCDMRNSALGYSGLDGQRGPHHEQPHLREHDRHRERHALVRRTPRVPGRQRADRQQLHLLEQLLRLRRRLTRSSRSSRFRPARA